MSRSRGLAARERRETVGESLEGDPVRQPVEKPDTTAATRIARMRSFLGELKLGIDPRKELFRVTDDLPVQREPAPQRHRSEFRLPVEAVAGEA